MWGVECGVGPRSIATLPRKERVAPCRWMATSSIALFGVRGSRFRVSGVGFGVDGFRLCVLGLGFRD